MLNNWYGHNGHHNNKDDEGNAGLTIFVKHFER